MTTTEGTTPCYTGTTLGELAEKLDTLVAEQHRTPVLSVIRGLLNETGLTRARGVLRDAPDVLGNAQESLRVAQETERRAQEQRQAAALEAEWDLGSRVRRDGNKTFIAVVENYDPNGTVKPERQVTADEAKTWVAAEAAKQPAVAKASDELRRAAEGTAAARDAVEVAKARLSVARHEVEAAIAELETLRLCIPRSEA